MYTDEQLLAAVEKHHTLTAAANSLGIARQTLSYHLRRIEDAVPTSPPSSLKTNGPRLTKQALKEAMTPPNSCRVAAFREILDPESLAVFDEALGYRQRQFPAVRLYDLLKKAGYPLSGIPKAEDISAHRSNRAPCRCKK